MGGLGLIPGLGRSPGEGKGFRILQHSGLENTMDFIVHGVAKGQTRLSDLHFLFHLGFPGGSDGKASVCNARHPGSTPGSGRSPGEENGNPL